MPREQFYFTTNSIFFRLLFFSVYVTRCYHGVLLYLRILLHGHVDVPLAREGLSRSWIKANLASALQTTWAVQPNQGQASHVVVHGQVHGHLLDSHVLGHVGMVPQNCGHVEACLPQIERAWVRHLRPTSSSPPLNSINFECPKTLHCIVTLENQAWTSKDNLRSK